MQYIVKESCYINRVLYEKGNIVEFKGDAPVKDYFEPVEGVAKVEEPAKVEAPVETAVKETKKKKK